MNSVLLWVVVVLAIHEIWACKFETESVYPTISDLTADVANKKWNIAVYRDLNNLKIKVTFQEGQIWNGDKISGELCGEDEDLDAFIQLLYTSIGVTTCNITEGEYTAKTENEFSDEVCSKVSEQTDGNDQKLYLTIMDESDAILHVRLGKI